MVDNNSIHCFNINVPKNNNKMPHGIINDWDVTSVFVVSDDTNVGNDDQRVRVTVDNGI